MPHRHGECYIASHSTAAAADCRSASHTQSQRQVTRPTPQQMLTNPDSVSDVISNAGISGMNVTSVLVHPSPPAQPPPLPPPAVLSCGVGMEPLSDGQCGKCPPGTYNDVPGDSCKACTAGYYCPELPPLGAVKPVPCPGGTYSSQTNLVGEDECTDVQIGYFAPLGSTAQRPCFQANTKFDCPAKAPLPVEGATLQTLEEGFLPSCPPGQKIILGTCLPCATGHYCQGGVEFACPLNTYNNMTSMPLEANCTRCPQPGTNCQRSSSDVTVTQGFYLSGPNANRGYPCPGGTEACIGGSNVFGNLGCAPGHEGPLCRTCQTNFFRGRFWDCIPCASLNTDEANDMNPIMIFLVLMGVGTLGLVVYLYPPSCGSPLAESSWGRLSRRLHLTCHAPFAAAHCGRRRLDQDHDPILSVPWRGPTLHKAQMAGTLRPDP